MGDWHSNNELTSLEERDFNPNPIALTFHELEKAGTSVMLPGGIKERRRLDEVSRELCAEKSVGWNTRLLIRRENLREVYGFLYGHIADIDLLPGLLGDGSNLVEINGWWD